MPADLISPGEILLEEFMRPLGLSQNKLADDLGIGASRINEIIHGRRAISPDTAMRLARYFESTTEFWMNLQMRYNMAIAEAEHGDEIRRQVMPHGSR